MAYEDSVNSTVQQAMDQGRNIANKASETVKAGYKAAQQYAQDNLSVDVADFVRREPWMAITAAFAIGYFAAQMIRRPSGRGIPPISRLMRRARWLPARISVGI